MERYKWINPIVKLGNLGIRMRFLKSIVKRYLEDKIYYYLVETKRNIYPKKMQEDKYYMVLSLLETMDRVISEGRICNKCLEGVLKVLITKTFGGEEQEKRKRIQKEKGLPTPLFITISPTGRCNLKCKNCYAGSVSLQDTLDFELFSKTIEEAKRLWGTSFIVISGGEPLIYKDKNKTIFDIFDKFQDVYFLMYTNGTLIDKRSAQRMAELGNITPAISIEGFKKETDERRGKGVFKKIMEAFDNLMKYGVPYGISVTLTRYNVETVMSEDFFDFYFEKKKVLYEWIFHYMPIGRKYSFKLMVTPKQRLWAWKRMQKTIRERKYFIVDFWNSGVISEGCIAGGRNSGYFYINWKGDVTPCVFIPYAVDNIYTLYQDGKDLNAILDSDYFKAIRNWQYSYAYKKRKKEMGNLLAPCCIRDHYKIFYHIAQKNKVNPIDEEAEMVMRDKEYLKKMHRFDTELWEITEKIWKKQYIEGR